MYCMHCGGQNPDSAKYCNHCGKPVRSSSGGSGGGGFFKRLIITMVVFAVFYGIGYAINSDDTGSSDSSKPDFKISSDTARTQPAAVQSAPSNSISDLGGSWEEVKLKDGNFNLRVSALAFSQTVYNCKELTVNMDVTMNAGTHCKDWQVWGRSGGKFVKIGKVYLPNGDGYVSQKLTFAKPVTFDAIAVTPTVVGGYSWSMALSITDVYTQ